VSEQVYEPHLKCGARQGLRVRIPPRAGFLFVQAVPVGLAQTGWLQRAITMRHLSCFAVLCAVLLAGGCALNESDRSWMAREFNLPADLEPATFESSPPEGESGWFGREGLVIKAVYKLSDLQMAKYVEKLRSDPHWHPLPVPESIAANVGRIDQRIEGLKEYNRQSRQHAAEQGRTRPPGIPVPTQEKLTREFISGLAGEAGSGFYRFQTVGNDLKHQPMRSDCNATDRVNDYIIGVLDTDKKELRCTAHSFY
jgi:hypothetical protein